MLNLNNFKAININKNEIERNIRLCILAIDTKNLESLDKILNNELKIKDIIFELYQRNYLIPGRLKFLLEKKNKTIIISSPLIKNLLRKKEYELLNIIFKNSKYFDNETILQFCYLYKYKKSVSRIELHKKINDEKYKIEINPEGKYLLDACEKGHEYKVRYLVEHGVDIHKNNPLEIACKNNNEAIIRYLIKHGANVNEKFGRKKDSPLKIACENGNNNVVKCLIEEGANVNDNEYLMMACKNENENIVKCLVKHGADVNKEDFYKVTPLITACLNGNENIIKYLVEYGANVNHKDDFDRTPLQIACENGKEAIVNYFIEHGADINYYGSLYAACKSNNETIVKILIENGANINEYYMIPGFKNDTPLIIACAEGYENIVKCLIEYGADVNLKNSDGETPINVANKYGHKNIVNYLKKHSTDINSKYTNSQPLKVAYKYGRKNLMESLKKHVNGIIAISPFFKKGQRSELFEILDDDIASFRVTLPDDEYKFIKRYYSLEEDIVLPNNATKYKTKNATLEVDLNNKEIFFDKVTLSQGGTSSFKRGKPGFNIKIRGKNNLYNRIQFKLRSGDSDASFIRSKLACDVYNSIGVPSISGNFIQLYINNEYMGLYTLMDSIKVSWIEYVFGEKNTQTLYKCSDYYNDLSVQSSYEGCFNENEDVLDVDQFLTGIALEYLMGSWDHFLSYGHNFFLYKIDGKWKYSTYDFDEEFGQDMRMPMPDFPSFDDFFGDEDEEEEEEEEEVVEEEVVEEERKKIRRRNILLQQRAEGDDLEGDDDPSNGYSVEWYDSYDYINHSFAEFSTSNHLLEILILSNSTRFDNIIKKVVTDVFNPATLFPHIDEIKKRIAPYIKFDKTPNSEGQYPGLWSENKISFTLEQWYDNSEFSDILYTMNRKYGLKYWILYKYIYICTVYNMACDPKYMDSEYDYQKDIVSFDEFFESIPKDTVIIKTKTATSTKPTNTNTNNSPSSSSVSENNQPNENNQSSNNNQSSENNQPEENNANHKISRSFTYMTLVSIISIITLLYIF
eukprot:jgi/Orpsp1_1/1184223/evm.model.c7180000088610.1